MIGNDILVRGVENGQRFNDRVEYHPTVYVEVPESRKTKFHTLDGKHIASIQPGTIKDTREFVKEHVYHDIYGVISWQYAYIADNYPDMKYDFDHIVVANIDIETGSENGFPNPQSALEEVQAITVATNDGHYQVFGTGFFEDKNKVAVKSLTYVKCKDEQDLLDRFLQYWQEIAPDIVTGWNIQMFDIPYLVNRIGRIKSPKHVKLLSPWKIVNERVLENMRWQGGKTVVLYDLVGCSTLDYYDLYKKFTYTNHESYRLDYIANVELGERKLSYEEYDNLHTLYRENYQLFIEYNIKDVQLIERLEDKMKLLEMAVALAYDAKTNYIDVFTQVRMWDVLIYNYLRERNIAIPPNHETQKNAAYTGAFVKDPKPGAYNWVVSFDLNSLYPHLIMQYNISPETLLEGKSYNVSIDRLLSQEVDTTDVLNQDICLAANGQAFSREHQGFLPAIMQSRYDNRVVYKKKMLEAKQRLENENDPTKRFSIEKEISQYSNLQMAMKISLNSAYGAMGNQYFRFFDMRLAEAITLGGQLSIRWAANAVNAYLNKVLSTEDYDYIIAADTDSLYVTLDGLVNEIFPGEKDTTKVINFLDKVCEESLQKVIDQAYNKLAAYLNAYEQKMFMKREALADKGIWTGKKHYLLNVYDNEGVRYREPKLKIMGIEAVKSSTPSACREKLKAAFNIIMTKKEKDIQEFIKQFRDDYPSLDIADIAFPRSVKGLEKYADQVSIFGKKCPIHVKGSLLYNKFILDNKLQKKYPLIQEGEKIKFIYLKEPNPIRQPVIAMLNGLPKEMNLLDYIDYETQFEKSFMEPLKSILNAVNWSPVEINTLDQFFQ